MKKRPADGKPRPPEAAPAFRPFAALKDKLPAPPAPAKPEPPTRREPTPRVPSTPPGGDAELLRMYYAGVTPLAGKQLRVPATAARIEKQPLPPAAPPGVDPDDEARARLRALVEGRSTFEVTDDGHRIEGRRADVDVRTVRRLRRGEDPAESMLDLHGFSAVEARREVDGFVARERAARARVVLIIHGKGNHSAGGMPILRGEIAAWLSEGAGAVHVAAFTTARPEDGGTGAMYVLLRS